MNALSLPPLSIDNPRLAQFVGSIVPASDGLLDPLSLVLALIGVALVCRIIQIVTQDAMYGTPRSAIQAYSETINQYIRKLPLRADASILHVGDDYVHLLGADNVRGICEETATYDVVVVQEFSLTPIAEAHVRPNGYLIVVSWPDRAGHTQILGCVRNKSYYDREVAN